MEQTAIPEVSLQSVGFTTLYMYAGMSAVLTIIILISTFTTCSKIHIGASFLVGLTATIIPAIIYGAALFFERFRSPFANVFKMMGVSPDRASTFGTYYILLLSILPFVVYGIHSAEESACVATPDEMTAFKTKMMMELQAKQELEEKNEKKK